MMRHTILVSLCCFLFLPLLSFGEEVRLAVGMNRDEAVAVIKKHGGVDITSGLAVVGPKGEWPLKGFYWEFKDYDAVIELSGRENSVTQISYWTKKNFGDSKLRRAQTEKKIIALKLDTKMKRVSLAFPPSAPPSGVGVPPAGAFDYVVSTIYVDPPEEEIVSLLYDRFLALLAGAKIKKGDAFSSASHFCHETQSHLIFVWSYYITPNELQGFEISIPKKLLEKKGRNYVAKANLQVDQITEHQQIKVIVLKRASQ
jgi:hypothetical protein